MRDFHAEMKRTAENKNVWVLGGGNLAAQFVEEGLVDELLLTFAPVILGAGIPFLPLRRVERLPLLGTRVCPSGMVQLRFALR